MQESLRSLPKIDKILESKEFENFNKSLVKKIAQKTLQNLRNQILENKITQTPSIDVILQNIKEHYNHLISPSIKPLINATGIVLQTNLGRSIFSEDMLDKIKPLLTNYSNLEYDIIEGKRGERYQHLTDIICTLFDCEDALIVNNNAAAVMLIINTFSKDKEVILSRGELVEIGGSFRIPEVITQSGGILREVGSTNKTHLKDYQNAINENTAMIMKVHQSNFTQIGFVQSVDYKDLSHLAKTNNLIDYYDVGSGYIDGINCDEPSLLEIAKAKPSLVSFSGDKLLGGPQAGIIFGKKNLIQSLKQNHLLRAIRIDKINLILLQEIFLAYLLGKQSQIPTIKMLSQTSEALFNKAQELQNILEKHPFLHTKIITIESKAGGGSLPHLDFPSYAIQIKHSKICTQDLHLLLRKNGIITRAFQDTILLDIRCIDTKHFEQIGLIFETLEE